MKTLAKVVAGMMVTEGTALAVSPHAYLKIWEHKSMPEWVREQAREWQKLSECTLRLLGVDLLLLAGLLVGASGEA